MLGVEVRPFSHLYSYRKKQNQVVPGWGKAVLLSSVQAAWKAREFVKHKIEKMWSGNVIQPA